MKSWGCLGVILMNPTNALKTAVITDTKLTISKSIYFARNE